MDHLVTIITASYNKSNFIVETIRSVLEQSYTNWELIIVDDCSTDVTVSLIKTTFKDTRIFLIENETNSGANYCRNLGLNYSKGNYIIYLDADDLLAVGCLEQRIKKAGEFPAANLLVFTMGVFYFKIGDDKRTWSPTSQFPLKDFLQHNLPWSILQPFWKRDFLIKLGGFDESFQRLQDVELNTRALLHKDVNYLLVNGLPDCYYRIDETRKNFNSFNFMFRWINSAIQYCNKFRNTIPTKEHAYLLGTLYQAYLALLNQLKTKLLSREEFIILESKLLISAKTISPGFIKYSLFKISGYYNLYCFRIPGINKLIKNLIVL